MKAAFLFSLLFALSGVQLSQRTVSGHEQMVRLLKNSVGKRDKFNSAAKLVRLDSLLSLVDRTEQSVRHDSYLKGNVLLELGRETEAIEMLEPLIGLELGYEPPKEKRSLALAYLRKGERSNCIVNHAAESCIMPIAGVGVYADQDWSRKAIALYTELLTKFPEDLESRWLLNVAYMTLGEYPEEVPAEFFIPGLEGDTTYSVKPFADVASSLNLDTRNMAGGSIIDDFDNDGYLDIMTSGWGPADAIQLFKNNANGTFSVLSDKLGLNGITGGLNIIQADYNNDGFQDVFVLRGGWKMEYGNDPNSLLRNNGDGTFTDVTLVSGLLSFHPTQTATWNDFNNDGWLDLFIGNESEIDKEKQQHPCELYMSNGNGTFREVAARANCGVVNYVKGVTSGDYDNDGWQDIFISTMDGERKLLRNKGRMQDGEIVFEDVTSTSGLDKAHNRTFPTWFWDYNNDGWLDIFTGDYSIQKSLAYSAAAEKLGLVNGSADRMLLYKNNGDGTFTNVAEGAGLNKSTFSMGSNFGDIDNDGFLDMYLGNGNPPLQAIISNKMYRNVKGEKFVDVTAAARVGHLQKGHAVSFADVDNDGDQDVHIHMGGAFPGDAYQNSFFLNPGQNDNNWICLKLEGTLSNRSAIGARIKITFEEDGIVRDVYRDVNSGGSFGASPLRREIGVGAAKKIERIEIRWPGSSDAQIFHDIPVNQFISIREGSDKVLPVDLKRISWALPDRLCYPDGRLIY